MNLIWGIILISVTLKVWIGQIIIAFSPKVAIVKKGQKSVITITPKEQKLAVEKILLHENSDYFTASYSNGTDSSSIYISIGNKEPPQQLVEGLMEVVIRLKDTEEERVLKMPIICIPRDYN